jgi:hypothetical protein
MKSWAKPTTEQVVKAIGLLARPEHNRYFFERLENPQWIEPLTERGFFRSPPEPIRDEEGRVRFPIWPASRYLARMASLAPDAALEVALSIDTENTSVHEDIADLALALPSEHAAVLAKKLAGWAVSPYAWGLPEKLASLAVRLASSNLREAALLLVNALIPLDAGPRREDGFAEIGREPAPAYPGWEYSAVLNALVPALAESLGREALAPFANALDAALDLWRSESSAPVDHSYIWRPAIEAHGQNLSIGAKDELVSATRDTAEAVVRTRPDDLLLVVEGLASRKWSIFKRLALHLLRLHADEVPEAVAERLTDPELFRSIAVRHEYTLLLSDRFRRLRDEQQRQILNLIAEPPAFDSGQLPVEEIASIQRRWQLERLEPIADHLPDEWRLRYAGLVEEYGRPEHPEFVSYSRGVWVGPTSPKTLDELRELGTNELIEYLKTWEPQSDPMSESAEGLGRALTAAIEQGRTDLFAEARRFREVDPTYVRALVAAARSLVSGGTVIDWPAVLDLCRWIVEQPREIPGREGDYVDLDPGWVWTRKEIANLLSAGLQPGGAEITYEQRELVWSILEPLTEDPQPMVRDEATESLDPLTLSINTVRGEAMHAAVRYALWVRKAREATGEATSLADLPEAQTVLEHHLDKRKDPSLAIRAVYGQWFPWLVLLDAAWAEDAVSLIFDESDDRYWHAAWDTYVVYDEPYNDVLPLLDRTYRQGIEKACREETTRVRGDPSARLAEHLAVFYWRGLITYDGGYDSLLDLFYECAGDDLRAHIIEFVGRALSHTEALEDSVATRLQDLWTLRLVEARHAPEEHRRELSAFGWWFGNAFFDATWRLDQLLDVLRLVGSVQPDFEVVTQLAELAQAHPRACADALNMMVLGDETSWWVHGAHDAVRAVLEATVDSDDSEARAATRDTVDILGQRGFLSFRDLFRLGG